MDSCIKTRKPYTKTKQRERWTEDEHNSFLEALKLYGRAWQRIEEHVGTKTAVQIRSHAQKFFTKLEKEAVAKGIPTGQALDVEIPPPRPKRKPNYPYPRKAHTPEAGNLERKPLPEKTSHTCNLENEKTSVETQNGIEGTREAPCVSLSLNESYATIETRKQDGIKHMDINSSLFESSHLAHENIVHGQYSAKLVNPINDIQGKPAYPRHVAVQVVDVHQEVGTKSKVPLEMSFHESKVNKLGEVHEHPNPANLFVNIAAASANSGQSYNHVSQSSTIPALHPPFHPENQENYRSFLHVSSIISSVIVSSLPQNPTADAAASFAARSWHPVNTEASSVDSFSTDQLNPETTPSMAAIASAIVAAATAWWSAHGLLPVCTPFYPGGSSCTFQAPVEEDQVRIANTGREKAPAEGVWEGEDTESAADLSSSDEPEMNLDVKETVAVVELHDSSKANVGKQIDRSSCGSNTSSCSEIEMDVLKKHGKETEEIKGSDVKESVSRRGKITISPSESWKGVSKEGRYAFQALFSGKVLPQSFSDNPTVAEKDQQNMNKNKNKNKNNDIDLNRMSQEPGESNNFVVLKGEEGVSRMGLGSVKVNVHHTGFRPYKRCSIEAKESCKIVNVASTDNDEKGPKKLRVGT